MKELGGRSLPIWAIILVVGVLAAFSMGCWNPFVRKGDRKRAKMFKSNGSASKAASPRVEVRFHFNGVLYLVAAMVFSLATLISFFIESFAKFKNMFFGGGIWGSLLALVIVLVVSFVLECILMVIPIVTEEKATSSIVARYTRRYDVGVIVKDY